MVGEFKDDQLQNHKHIAWITTLSPPHYWGYSSEPIAYRDQEEYGGWNTGRGGDVTRGKRKGIKYIIKVL